MVHPLEDIQQRGGTPISTATIIIPTIIIAITATTIIIIPIIAITATIATKRLSNATLNPCAVSRELSNIRSNASRFVSGQQLRRWSPEEPLELSQTPDPGIKHRMRVMVCISPEARSA